MLYINRLNLLLIIFCTVAIKLHAQDNLTGRWEPGVSFTKKLKDKWETNLQAKARAINGEKDENRSQMQLASIDVRGYLTYNLYNQSKLTLGYINRSNDPFENGSTERRLIEQFAFFARTGKFRYTHKIVLEQRIIERNFTGRLRYALSNDFPLQGTSLDPGEMYFISGATMLYSFNSYSQGLENRLSAGIGKVFTSGQKFQLEIESRFADLLENRKRTLLQLSTTFYLNY